MVPIEEIPFNKPSKTEISLKRNLLLVTRDSVIERFSILNKHINHYRKICESGSARDRNKISFWKIFD